MSATYNSRSAQLLRAATARLPVVWSPETGWTDPAPVAPGQAPDAPEGPVGGTQGT